MEKKLKRDLLLATEQCELDHLCVLGATKRLPGLDARPVLDGLSEWIPPLLVWLRQFRDETYVHDLVIERRLHLPT